MMKRSTAIHEAGHAVIGRVLDLVCGQVSVVEDDDSAGHSICADPWATCGVWDRQEKYHRGIEECLRARIMAFMAGAEAEAEILGQCAGGDGDDRDQIAYMLDTLQLSDHDWFRWEQRLRRQCRRLVRKHRFKILKVADALHLKETMHGDEIDRLLSDLVGDG